MDADKEKVGQSEKDSQSSQSHAQMEPEEEYMIAADLTLYSNPLNRLLCRQIPTSSGSEKNESSASGESNSMDENDIAADMKQYTNPLAELDKYHKDKKNELE